MASRPRFGSQGPRTLPKEEQSPEELLEQDFEHDELIRQMMEYARYKRVANSRKRGGELRRVYRGRLEKTQSDDDTLADANVWQLFGRSRKFRSPVGRNGAPRGVGLCDDRRSSAVHQQYLAKNGRALFEDLPGDDPHPMLAVVTFMALMEMIKTDEVVFRQGEVPDLSGYTAARTIPEFAEEMANEVVRYAPETE